MNIISFVNITYLRIVLIYYFHCVMCDLHVTVHKNYFCIAVLHNSCFHNTTVWSIHSIKKIEYRHMFDLLMDIELYKIKFHMCH